MNSEQIISTARRNGGKRFVVSWRYRDDGIRNQCRSLVQAGVMRKVLEGPGHDTFVLQSEEAIAKWRAEREAKKEYRKTHPNPISQRVKARKLASKLRQSNAQNAKGNL